MTRARCLFGPPSCSRAKAAKARQKPGGHEHPPGFSALWLDKAIHVHPLRARSDARSSSASLAGPDPAQHGCEPTAILILAPQFAPGLPIRLAPRVDLLREVFYKPVEPLDQPSHAADAARGCCPPTTARSPSLREARLAAPDALASRQRLWGRCTGRHRQEGGCSRLSKGAAPGSVRRCSRIAGSPALSQRPRTVRIQRALEPSREATSPGVWPSFISQRICQWVPSTGLVALGERSCRSAAVTSVVTTTPFAMTLFYAL